MSATANFPYKKRLKAIAIVKPSEFHYSLAVCDDNFDAFTLYVVALVSVQKYLSEDRFDAFQFHRLRFISLTWQTLLRES